MKFYKLSWKQLEKDCYALGKIIKDKKIAGFFDDAVVRWYEQIFLKHYSEEEVNNPKNYQEFKKLYHSVKLKQQK